MDFDGYELLSLPGRFISDYWCSKPYKRRSEMTLCPIALVASCKKCPIFTVCPLKSVIGDYKKPDQGQTKQREKKAPSSSKRKR